MGVWLLAQMRLLSASDFVFRGESGSLAGLGRVKAKRVIRPGVQRRALYHLQRRCLRAAARPQLHARARTRRRNDRARVDDSVLGDQGRGEGGDEVDVGGGSGAHSIGACLHWPQLAAIVLDMQIGRAHV